LAALYAASGMALAQERGTSDAALAQKAEALTRQQIKAARDPGSLVKLSQVYVAQADSERFTWTLERLVELLPNSGNLKLQLAMAYAGGGDKTKAYDTLVRLLNLGYSYPIEADPRFQDIKGNRVWDYIVTNNNNNAKQFGEGKVAFELPKGDRLIESLAWDPKRKEFLAGSVREGKVYLVDSSGKLGDFIAADADNGLWAVYALAVDAARDKLYVISNGVPHFKDFKADMLGNAGLFEFALSTGKLVHKYILPQDQRSHILSSIAVGDNGRVFVADGVNDQIYRLDGGALKLLTENPALTGIRGMAVSGDGKTLYFSDVSLGIFGMDLAKLAPFELAHNPDKLTLGGIDALYWYDGTLAVIQNGMSPQRVMRLKLAPDGRSVANAMPLDVAQPAFTSLATGTVSGDGLYSIANSQKGLYDSYGVLTEANKLEPLKIFRSNLRFAWDDKGVGSTLPTKKTPALSPKDLQEMLNTAPKGFVPPPAKKGDADKDKKPAAGQQG
jgi:sugar lactone lactonase YvrE